MNPHLLPFFDFTAPFEGGFRAYMYHDSKKIPTFAYGFNLTRRDARRRLADVGLDFDAVMAKRQGATEEQGRRLMSTDLAFAFSQVSIRFPGLAKLPDIVQKILVDVVYNMGPGRVFDDPRTEKVEGFAGFVRAVKARDWATAAGELKYHKIGEPRLTGYYEDTKTRAQHHISKLLQLHKERIP